MGSSYLLDANSRLTVMFPYGSQALYSVCQRDLSPVPGSNHFTAIPIGRLMRMRRIQIRLSLFLFVATCGLSSDASDKMPLPSAAEKTEPLSVVASNRFNLDVLRVRITDHITNFGRYELRSVSTQMAVVATARGKHGGTMQWILAPCESKGATAMRVVRSDDLSDLTFPVDETLHTRLLAMSEPHAEFAMEEGKLSGAVYNYLLANHMGDVDREWQAAFYKFTRLQPITRLTFHRTEPLVSGRNEVEVSYFLDEYGIVLFYGPSAIIMVGSRVERKE